ncbi:hypothetical protein [Secundilactobacillus paracollinoides]|uniref:hypothetical protein n=1 Tax=Secundilactobacillus paracollinoides TaxID=240427 RepID=UPI0006D26469|nr:hypothetical protein [Secundilactobacillus paracollinoides]
MQILTGVSDTFNKDVNRRRYLDITTLSLSKVTGRRSFSLTKAGWQNVIALIDVSHTDSDLNTIVINRNNIIFAITSTVDQLIQQLQNTFPFDYVTSIKHGIGPELDLEDPPPYVAGDFWISPYPGKEPGEQNWLVWAPWDMTWHIRQPSLSQDCRQRDAAVACFAGAYRPADARHVLPDAV